MKNISYYGAGNFIAKLITFFLLPIYWRLLTPEELGFVGVTLMVTGVLAPIAESGLGATLLRFYPDWKSEDKLRGISTLWTLSLLINLSFFILCFGFGVFFTEVITSKITFFPFLFVGLLCVLFQTLAVIPFSIYRVLEDLKKYSAFLIAGALIQNLVSLVLIYKFQFGAIGYIIGISVGHFIVASLFTWSIRDKISFCLDRAFIKEAVKYCLPLVPFTIIQGINSNLDKFFLTKLGSIGSLGIYDQAKKIGNGVTFINHIFRSAFSPMIFSIVSDRNDAKKLLAETGLFYLALMSCAATLVVLFAKELIGILGPTQFAEVGDVLPLIAFAFFIYSVSSSIGKGIDISKKTILFPAASLASLGVGLFCIPYFTELYGIYGCALGLICMSTANTIVESVLGIIYFPRPLQLNRVLIMISLVGACAYVGFKFPSNLETVLVKITMVLVILPMILVMGFGIQNWKITIVKLKHRFIS